MVDSGNEVIEDVVVVDFVTRLVVKVITVLAFKSFVLPDFVPVSEKENYFDVEDLVCTNLDGVCFHVENRNGASEVPVCSNKKNLQGTQVEEG